LRLFFSALAVGLLAASVAGAALAYDGSYLMYRMLEGQWFWVEHGRLTHALAQFAPLLASRLTHNLPVLAFLMTIGYTCIPLLALAASWWLVRDRAPELFVWSALGALLVAMPGLFCLIADTLLVEQLAWPLFLGALVGIPRKLVPVVLIISVIVGTSHPVGFILFGVASALSWIAGRRAPDQRESHRRWAGVFLAMSVATLIRVVVGVDAYEKHTLTLESFSATWASAVLGWPLLSIGLAWLAGLLIFGERHLARTAPARTAALRWLKGAAVLALTCSGLALLPWAANPKAWAGAIGYRLYFGFATAPFILAALLERMATWRRASGPMPIVRREPSRRAYVNTIGVTCALVLAVQSGSWFALTARLQRTMGSEVKGCVSFNAPEMQWAADTVLSHWSISTYSLIVQGARPGAIVLPAGVCGQIDLRAGLYLTPWYTGGWNTRWFQMDRLRP
jgi:hypothetical protein